MPPHCRYNAPMARDFRDYTSGSIGGAIWRLSLPIVVSNAAHIVVGLTDAFWVARLPGDLGTKSMASVVMAGQVMFLLASVFMGISAASAALVARAIGAKDNDRADHVAAQAIVLTVAVSVVLGIVGYILTPWLLTTLGAEDDVIALGTGYLRISFLGVFAMFALFVGSGILRGAGDATTPLVIMLVAAAVNIGLDPILIRGYLGFPALGVSGAAIATVASRLVAFTYGAFVLMGGKLRVRLHLRAFRFDPAVLGKLVVIGFPASVQMSLRAVMGVVLVGVASGFGTAVIAAFGIGMRISHIAFMPTFGIGQASAALVGQNLGAGKPERASRSAVVSAAAAVFIMGSFAVIFSAFAPELIGIFKKDPAVLDAGISFLRIRAPGLLFAAVGIVLGRSIGGAGDTFPTMIFTVVALWFVQVPVAVWLSGFPALAETGIWWAGVVASVANVLMTGPYFASGRWKQRKV